MEAGMDLKQFVRVTLTAILEGVAEAQAAAEKIGARVNPVGKGFAADKINKPLHGSPNATRIVTFDVAVVSAEGTQTKGGLGVLVAPFWLGTQGASKKEASAVSRVQFEVPILFPGQDQK